MTQATKERQRRVPSDWDIPLLTIAFQLFAFALIEIAWALHG